MKAKKKSTKKTAKKSSKSAAPPEMKSLPPELRAMHALVELLLLDDRSDADQQRARGLLLDGFMRWTPAEIRDTKWLDVGEVERHIADVLCGGEPVSWRASEGGARAVVSPLRARASELARALVVEVFDLRGTKLSTLVPEYCKRLQAETDAARAAAEAKRKAELAAQREKWKAQDKARLARQAAAKKAAKTKASKAKPRPVTATPKPNGSAKRQLPMAGLDAGEVASA